MIPDLVISESDSIRPEYINYDFKSINNKRLVLIDETKWINRVDSPKVIKYCKMYIFKKE
jgi:hypothetical protein